MVAVTIEVERGENKDGASTYVTSDITERVIGQSGPIHATWYSGAMVVPTGKLVDYVHMGYGSTYASYLLLVIKNGMLTKQVSMTHDEFEKYKQQSFLHYKTTSEYAKHVAEMREQYPDMKQEQMDDFLYSFAAEAYLSAIRADD